MKINWKPLSSFFKSTTTAEEKGKKEGKKAGDDQGDNGDDQGDDQGDDDDDQGNDDDDQSDDQGNDQGKNAKKTAKEATISIKQSEYKAFIAAQMELEKFGKTPQDRNNFLKDATQLSVWYQAAVGVGATSNSDASAQEKNTKKESNVTRQAKEAYQKAAAKNPKK